MQRFYRPNHSMRACVRNAAAGLFLLAFSMLNPIEARAQSFETLAEQAILIDVATGAVLFEKNADTPFMPGAMAKVMTAEVVFSELDRKALTVETEIAISENTWRKGGGPSGGPAMFADLNSRVKVSDLLRGLIVQSGNDAALALADGIKGGEAAFVSLMNEHAVTLRLQHTRFKNVTGFSDPEQTTTARDLANLAMHVIGTYPEYYKIFAEKEFTWNKIRQQNRNPLIALNIGVDGLKSGQTSESGFGLVASSVQAGQRLVLVLSGLKSARDGASEAQKLLEWGYRTFEERNLFAAGEEIAQIGVYGGTLGSVGVVSKIPVNVLIARTSPDRVTAKILYSGPLRAPVAKNQEIGRVQIRRGDMVALEMPVYAAEDIAAGGLAGRAFDGFLEMTGNLIRRMMGNG